MERITKNFYLLIPALLIATSFIAEYHYCFDEWLTNPGSSYVFMILCVTVQIICAEVICFSLGARHSLAVMLGASLGSGTLFSAMLWWNLHISMDNNSETLHSAMIFNMLPLVTGAVLLAFQLMFTGLSGRMKLRAVK